MRKLLMFSGALLLVFGVAGMVGATQLITNGDFSNGLNGWVASGDVALGTDGESALLGKTTKTADSFLAQVFSIPTDATSLTVSFDFAISYHDKDTFGGLIQSYDQFFSIVCDNIFAWAFDFENLLVFSTVNTGNGYTLYSGTYTEQVDITDWAGFFDPLDYGTIRFVLDESMLADTDSYVGIDNVSIDDGLDAAVPTAATPEPATLLLLGVGLLGIAGVKRRFIKK